MDKSDDWIPDRNITVQLNGFLVSRWTRLTG